MLENIQSFSDEGLIKKTTAENLISWIKQENTPHWVTDSINQLIEEKHWDEINNRFFKNISFGTGGIRGRTISKTITNIEAGNQKKGQTPNYATVGTNSLNELVIVRATVALFEYTIEKLIQKGSLQQPSIVVAHDVRHFSKKFSQIISDTWTHLGGISFQFDGPRSTPQLSYTIRSRGLHAGVVVTASHNPFHDNGFKAYSEDGSQISGEEAYNIVEKYNNTQWEKVFSFFTVDNKINNEETKILPKIDDFNYLSALEDSVLNIELLQEHCPKVVFTPIHGTGAISSVPGLWELGANIKVFDEQNDFDPNFSSVKSPNPENPEALSKAINFAKKTNSDVVLGTDPDCDRVGIAVKNHKNFECLTGNQVGAILAEYRLQELQRKQILKQENSKGFCILKTFVTSGLLSKIAENYGATCINTPTGFKWMAKKLKSYEEQAVEAIYEKEGIGLNYNKTDLFSRIEILSRYSKCAVLCAEESYGYLPIDTVRDKDGNASSLAICEALSYLKSQEVSPMEFLDQLYTKYGYHLEETKNIYLEGAKGSEEIKKIMDSFRETPPTKIGSLSVQKIVDFNIPGLYDEDKEVIALENFLILHLDEGFRIAIRPSGTEPKLKFYIFGEGSPVAKVLEDEKNKVHQLYQEVSSELKKEVDQRRN